jgi:hypothetical protein
LGQLLDLLWPDPAHDIVTVDQRLHFQIAGVTKDTEPRTVTMGKRIVTIPAGSDVLVYVPKPDARPTGSPNVPLLP